MENVRRSWDQFAVKEKQIATTNYAAKADVEQNLEMMSQLTHRYQREKSLKTLMIGSTQLKHWRTPQTTWVHVKLLSTKRQW
ncbi:hypothetical protein JCM19233_3701 [Vibrio astriarenae]|nr:hypothetical protein JCM19233_3701 [Vibrio sp. C7]